MSLHSTATLQSVTFYNTITYYLSSGPMKRRMLGKCCGISPSPVTLSRGRMTQSRVLNEKPPWCSVGFLLEPVFRCSLNLFRAVVVIQGMKSESSMMGTVGSSRTTLKSGSLIVAFLSQRLVYFTFRRTGKLSSRKQDYFSVSTGRWVDVSSRSPL